MLTNLKDTNTWTSKALEPGAKALPVIVRGSKMRLEVAAALNANFPPVFPNAAIDVDGVDRQDKPIPATRYWVTDGGAVDNRGIEMMLFALRAALKNLADNPLPRIHLIIADASALSDHFEQDRGLSSASGAGSHFASHLDAELVQVIKELYPRDSDRFTYSYLMMPDVLRTSGSFGTHWMLQPTVRVKQPLPPGDLDHSHDLASVTLSGEETVELIRAMHATKTKTAKTNPQALSADACKVMGWAEGDAGHGEGWKALLTALQASAETSKCAPRR